MRVEVEVDLSVPSSDMLDELIGHIAEYSYVDEKTDIGWKPVGGGFMLHFVIADSKACWLEIFQHTYQALMLAWNLTGIRLTMKEVIAGIRHDKTIK